MKKLLITAVGLIAYQAQAKDIYVHTSWSKKATAVIEKTAKFNEISVTCPVYMQDPDRRHVQEDYMGVIYITDYNAVDLYQSEKASPYELQALKFKSPSSNPVMVMCNLCSKYSITVFDKTTKQIFEIKPQTIKVSITPPGSTTFEVTAQQESKKIGFSSSFSYLPLKGEYVTFIMLNMNEGVGSSIAKPSMKVMDWRMANKTYASYFKNRQDLIFGSNSFTSSGSSVIFSGQS